MLKKLISNIEKRPLMYLDEISITSLSDFLGGYFMGKHLSKNLSRDDKIFQDEFYNFIKTKYNLEDNQSWKVLLQNQHKEQAFKHFFTDFSEFEKLYLAN